MVQNKPNGTCLHLLYSCLSFNLSVHTSVNQKTAKSACIPISWISRVLILLVTGTSLLACTDRSERMAYDQVYDVFGNMENEEDFWLQIDTVHVMIADEEFAQARARLIKTRTSSHNQAHKDIIKTITHKIKVLERRKGDIQAFRQNAQVGFDPYLKSTHPADLMLAYNLATGYIKSLARELESISFPKALEKRKHVVFYEGAYRIRSYASILTLSGKKIKSQFNCDIKLHKDRRNFTIESLEIIK